MEKVEFWSFPENNQRHKGNQTESHCDAQWLCITMTFCLVPFMPLVVNPSEIDQNQLLLVKFLNFCGDDVIIPGTANLSFNIELSSTANPKRSLVSNIGRAIVKKLVVKFEGDEILGVDNFDVFASYRDL